MKIALCSFALAAAWLWVVRWDEARAKASEPLYMRSETVEGSDGQTVTWTVTSNHPLPENGLTSR